MEQAIQFINEVGFPIAAALGLGFFIWKLINRIIDGMETKLDVLDDKVADQIEQMELRLGTKLDSQHGILVALIDRVNEVYVREGMKKVTMDDMAKKLNVSKKTLYK